VQRGLGLTTTHSDYIQIRSPVYISHSAGRYAVKRFRKAQCPIIERLTNSLMMNGRNNGKKLMAVRIVAHAFEIVCLPANAKFLESDHDWQNSSKY
jgi:small subunit ribosomal protein S5e